MDDYQVFDDKVVAAGCSAGGDGGAGGVGGGVASFLLSETSHEADICSSSLVGAPPKVIPIGGNDIPQMCLHLFLQFILASANMQ